MALFAFAITRFQQTLSHSLLSLASRPAVHPSIFAFSSAWYVSCLSQAFRRTVVVPSNNTLSHGSYFSTLQPFSLGEPHYYPIDFNYFKTSNNSDSELAVELVRKATDPALGKEVVNSLDVNQVYLAIWALRNDWEMAKFAFELNVNLGSIDEKLLALIVWVLGSHQKFDIAWSLIRDSRHLVNIRQALLAIIERYAAANCHVKAIKTFHFMEELTASPDQSAFYTIMSALCRYGNVEEAEEFMLKHRKLYPLETEGFNIILHGWCNISVDVFEAKRVWREMASYCITPDAMSYTHMISCFSRTGNLFDSLRLYDEMKKRGWVPGIEVYNSLMYVMTHENCFVEALKILAKIKEMGLQPDTKSYNCLICPLCEAGKFEEARSVLATMTQEGYKPTIETYHAFLKGANSESAFDILSQMKKDQVGPDSRTFLLAFDRFFKLREPENVLKMWVEMRNYGVHLESAHYMSLICGLVDCRCLIKAKELHTEMISNGFVDDPKLKKLFEGQAQESCRGEGGPMNIVRNVDELKSPSTSHIRQHRGRKKRGGQSKKKKQTVA